MERKEGEQGAQRKLPNSRSNQFKTIDSKDLEGSIIAWLLGWLFVCHALLMRFSRLPLTSQSRQVQSYTANLPRTPNIFTDSGPPMY